MFVESRRVPPRVRGPWQAVAAAFYEGDIPAAIERARGLDPVDDPEVILLRVDLLRAVGRERAFHELIEKAAKTHPKDARIQLQWIRALSMRGRQLAAERLIDALAPNLKGPIRKVLDGLRASVLAQMQRTEPARRVLARIDGSDVLADYEAAYAQLNLREWSGALERLDRVCKACPRWTRPQVMRYRCLGALDRHDEARAVLESVLRDLPYDLLVTYAHLGHLYATKDMAALVKRLEEHLEQAPRLDDDEHAKESREAERGLLVRALWHVGRHDEAVALATELDEKLGEKLGKAERLDSTKRVDVEPLVQPKNMCVATCVAMTLRHRGQQVDPAEIYAEMGGSIGVASWQLDRWLLDRGIEPLDIALTPAAIKTAIDQGFTLLATRSHMLMGHMELIVGYDDAFGEVEVIDPAFGLPLYVQYDALKEEYGGSGETLCALIPSDGPRPKIPLDQVVSASRKVNRDLWAERIDEAQRGHAALDADSFLARRYLLAHPEAFLPSGARDEEVDVSSRVQASLALLSLGEVDKGSEILRDLRQHTNPFFRSYLRMLRARGRGDWKRMQRCCELLLERAAQIPEMWFSYAIALQGNGHYQRAEEARAICLEIEPEHPDANLAILGERSVERPLQQRYDRTLALLRVHKRSEPLRALASRLAFELGDPLESERLLKDSVRLGPYSIGAALALRSYYLSQSRPDLAEAVPLPVEPDEASPEVTTTLVNQTVETLFSLASEELRGEGAHETGGAALTKLLERQEQGVLTPEERVGLALLRLSALLPHGPTEEQVAPLLPELAHPRALHLEGFLADLPPCGPGPARAVAAWADGQMQGEEWTPGARYERAIFDQFAGRTADAEATFTELHEQHQLLEARFGLGMIALHRNLTKEAIRHFEAVVEQSAAFTGALQNLVLLYEGSGDERGQRRTLRTLLKLLPYDPGPAYQWLESVTADGSHQTGASWLKANGERYPETFRRVWEVRFLALQGRWREVLQAADALKDDDPREALVLELRAYDGERRLDRHVNRVEQAVEQFPDDPIFSSLLASLLMERNPRRARELFVQTLAKDPSPGGLLDVLQHLMPEQPVPFLAGIADRIEDRPTLERFYQACFQVFATLDMWHTALEVFERFEKETPDSVTPVLHLLGIHDHLGLYSQNPPLIKKLEELAPKDPATDWACGVAFERTDPGRALRHFEAYEAATRDPDTYARMGLCLQRLGKRSQATELFWRGIEAQGQAGDPYAVAALALGGAEPSRLREPWQAAMSRPPFNVPGFAVTGVRLALAYDTPLPPEWEPWAFARAQSLELTRAREGPEGRELRSILAVWCGTTGRIDPFQEIYGAPPGRAERRGGSEPWGIDKSWIPQGLPGISSRQPAVQLPRDPAVWVAAAAVLVAILGGLYALFGDHGWGGGEEQPGEGPVAAATRNPAAGAARKTARRKASKPKATSTHDAVSAAVKRLFGGPRTDLAENAKAVAKLGRPGYAALVRELRGNDPVRRKRARTALHKLPPKPCAIVLGEDLRSAATGKLPEEYLGAVVDLGDEGVKLMNELCRSRKRSRKLKGLELARALAPHEVDAAPLLYRSLVAPDDRVRRAAAELLKGHQPSQALVRDKTARKAALDALAQALRADDREIAPQAGRIFGQFGTYARGSVTALTRHVRRNRRWALEALGEIGPGGRTLTGELLRLIKRANDPTLALDTLRQVQGRKRSARRLLALCEKGVPLRLIPHLAPRLTKDGYGSSFHKAVNLPRIRAFAQENRNPGSGAYDVRVRKSEMFPVKPKWDRPYINIHRLELREGQRVRVGALYAQNVEVVGPKERWDPTKHHKPGVGYKWRSDIRYRARATGTHLVLVIINMYRSEGSYRIFYTPLK